MTDLVHPYEKLTLFQLGIPIALYLISLHAFMLLRPETCKVWIKRLPRHYMAGVVVMGIALAWFWILVSPSRMPVFSSLSSLSMNLAEFNSMKPLLRLVIPLFFIGMCLYVKEFLFVRGLGLLGIIAAGPILIGGMFKDDPTRFVLPVFAYIILTAGMYCVGMPYLFRDFSNWLLKEDRRYQWSAGIGFGYGIVVLLFSLLFWR